MIEAAQQDRSVARPKIRTTRRASSTAFAVAASADAVRRRVEAAAATHPQFRLVAIDGANAVLHRRTNWVTWGGPIDIAWSSDDPAATAVHIVATRRLPTALGDYGQGARDLSTIFDAVAADAG